jgi:hypothetical protein
VTERLRESEENELLRRVDWRFLLNQEREPTVVSVASGRLGKALELVSTAVTPLAATAGPSDLAVVVNPGRRALSAAFDALRAGGELYAEWSLPTPGGPARARRRLEAAGFTTVRCYWPWPRPERAAPQFWLPLDALPAVDEFLLWRRSLDPRPWRRALIEALWRPFARAGMLTPICAIARKPPEEESGLEASIRAPAAAKSEPLSWLLMTGGKRSINKAVGFAFGNTERKPLLVVKFARKAAQEPALQCEASILRILAGSRPDLGGVPRVVLLDRRCGRVALGESVLGGRPVIEMLDRTTFAEIADSVTRWLVALAGETQPQRPEFWHSRLVTEPLRAFCERFGAVLEPDERSRVQALLASLGPLPVVVEHRDCSPWNVLRDPSGNLGLVDWESAEPSGLPYLDLAYFLMYAAFFVEGTMKLGAAAKAYRRMLDSSTPTGEVVERCVRFYCERVGVEQPALSPLRSLCWIVHSQSEFERLEQDAGELPGEDVLRGSFFVELLRQELRSDSRAAQSP